MKTLLLAVSALMAVTIAVWLSIGTPTDLNSFGYEPEISQQIPSPTVSRIPVAKATERPQEDSQSVRVFQQRLTEMEDQLRVVTRRVNAFETEEHPTSQAAIAQQDEADGGIDTADDYEREQAAEIQQLQESLSVVDSVATQALHDSLSTIENSMEVDLDFRMESYTCSASACGIDIVSRTGDSAASSFGNQARMLFPGRNFTIVYDHQDTGGARAYVRFEDGV
ncbi:MAG: hypothetical protein H6993_10575 [Pseudomonadales bacterium]|nr:hypothetical protein [Pseudomonadales bacterium]